jgi:hypothetical protein
VKLITLTKGYEAIVDDEDYEMLNQYNWYAKTSPSHDKIYAGSAIKVSKNTYRHVMLHRFLMNPKDNEVVDHINGNTLDNRRCNLRNCTPSQNCANKRKWKTKSTLSKYKGVKFDKRWGTWGAQIYFPGHKRHIGTFKTEREAAIAYNEKAKELFGEFAKLNEIENE